MPGAKCWSQISQHRDHCSSTINLSRPLRRFCLGVLFVEYIEALVDAAIEWMRGMMGISRSGLPA